LPAKTSLTLMSSGSRTAKACSECEVILHFPPQDRLARIDIGDHQFELASPRRFCREVDDEDARPTGRELDLAAGLDEAFGGLDRTPDNLVVLHRGHTVASRWRVLAEKVSVDSQLDLENGVRDLGTTFQLECHRRPTRFGPTHGRGVAQERDNELLRREAAEIGRAHV